MAIYRGAGGAGDATGDATNAAALAISKANEAAQSATNASSSATSAAASASDAADSASDASTSASTATTKASDAATSASAAASRATDAETAQTAAEAAQAAAEDAESGASTSATNASNSATAAATSATNASNSATAASTSASNASSSASSAATSATSAGNSATAAASSATSAASSASAAATSETNAASSASSASTSASTATTKASEASTSATNAASSASSASTSAANASNSASAASTSASNASTSATNAASSATAAASSATAAAASATAADASADAAAASAASIDVSGFMQKANNLSDVTSTSTARTNLGVAIGTNVQAYSSELQAIASSGNAMFKNRIINGAMMIDQRNAGASVTNQASRIYALDRWASLGSAGSKFTIQQTPSATESGYATRVGAGFTNYMAITSSAATSVASGDYYTMEQRIEGFNTADLAWGTANAKAITISFLVYSSLTGTFGGSVVNSGQNRSYPFTYTISSASTWEQKTITIAGDTSGTWVTNNGIGIDLIFSLGVGSTYSNTAGAWVGSLAFSATGATNVVSTNGATWYITGVHLEKGSTATSFDYRPYGTELALCQRYYWKATVSWSNYGTSGAYVGSWMPFPVTMRASPTITLSGGSSGANGSPQAAYANPAGFRATILFSNTGVAYWDDGIAQAAVEL